MLLYIFLPTFYSILFYSRFRFPFPIFPFLFHIHVGSISINYSEGTCNEKHYEMLSLPPVFKSPSGTLKVIHSNSYISPKYYKVNGKELYIHNDYSIPLGVYSL